MSSRQVEPKAWGLRRWLLIIGVIFIIQYGLITWLGRPAVDTQPRQPRHIPPIALLSGGRESEIHGLEKPALLLLADPRSFSGEAWLVADALRNPSRPWTEPPRALPPPIDEFGGSLESVVRSNLLRRVDVARKPMPAIPDYFAIEPPSQSTFSIEGPVARRRLLTGFKLDSKPAPDILSNSEVQIAVDAGGNVFSAVLMPGGKSGSPEADADALRLARSARFQPLIRDGPDRGASTIPAGLDWGRIIFHWNTAPMPAPVTNGIPPPR